MTSKNKHIQVVAGATATGKTNFAIELAKKIDGELINADSRQVYKFMDIGTNKGECRIQNAEFRIGPKVINAFELEQSGVIGWMLDVVKPDESFSISDYLGLVHPLIEDILDRGKYVVIVGGTGLYIDALVSNYNLENTKPDNELRSELEVLKIEQLQEMLKETEEFKKLNESDRKNKRRLVRLMEKFQSGVKEEQKMPAYVTEIHYLSLPREELYERINKRAEQMFEEGLVDEVKKLINRGYKNTKPMQGMGYREVIKYLDGEMTFDEALEKMKQAHRNYAKRQVTWFEGKMGLTRNT